MTELSDELLVAYVDGQLARDQTRAVDKVLVQDDVIAQRVEVLKQAHGRLECAFEAILAGEVGEIMANTPTMPLPVARPRGNGLVKIGVATVVTGLVLFVLVAGYGWPFGQQPAVAPAAVNQPLVAPPPAPLPKRVEMAPPTWQDEVLRAQALLSRSSVEVGLESQGNRDLVAFQLAQAIGPAVKLPDLKAEGLKFMRAQFLRFDGKPLAQMLYLGTERAPLALYAMRGGGKARPLFRREGAIGSVSWKEDGIAYLLAGEENEARLLRLAEQIKHEPAATEPAPPRKLSDVTSGPIASGAEPIDPSAADPIITGSNPTMPSSPAH
ncbi:MAG: hypothetical protein WBF40_11475 [Methyloceanibacter sp.]